MRIHDFEATGLKLNIILFRLSTLHQYMRAPPGNTQLHCTHTVRIVHKNTPTHRGRKKAYASTLSLTYTVYLQTHALLNSFTASLHGRAKLIATAEQSGTRLHQHRQSSFQPQPIHRTAHALHQHLVDICAVPALSICRGSQKTNDHVRPVARLYV